ncbi:MAG: dCTP deaminase [Magnetococcales bacterium]|nr:dCTP deaminase [Magnetococcales bacterium]
MRLSDRDIQAAIKDGRIGIDPMPDDACFGSFSVDVSLGNKFVKIKKKEEQEQSYVYLTSKMMMESFHDIFTREVTVKDHENVIINPGQFLLGMTRERIKIPNYLVGWLDGRSSLARVGLMVHMTAHAIDPGFDGHITFEFFNAGRLPLVLNPGMRIGAISFEMLSSPCMRPYGSKPGAKYQGQETPCVASVLAG